TTAKVEPAIAAVVANAGSRDPPLVLVVPHHGSKTSSSENYLRALHPQFAIASAGYRNRFRHPAAVVVARYRQLDIPLSTTADTGAVRIAFPADAPPRIVSEERSKQTRY